jgi:hypothetical protein
MLEHAYQFTRTDAFVMEKIVHDERVNINHIVVAPNGAVPTLISNWHVHQIVAHGTLSLSLEDGPFNHHPARSIVKARSGQSQGAPYPAVQKPGPDAPPWPPRRQRRAATASRILCT